MEQAKLFWWGMMISFLGSIPLGTMNVTITNISVQDGIMPAWWFAFGATVIEILYVRLGLVAMDKLVKHQKVFRAFEWLTVLLLLGLAVFSLLAAVKMKGLAAAVPSYDLPPLLLGIFLSLIHPLHIPFWFGWSTVLVEKKILQPSPRNYNVFVSGIATGSFIGFALFIYGSHYMLSQVKSNEHIVNYVIGFILLLTACIQMYRILPARLELKHIVLQPQRAQG